MSLIVSSEHQESAIAVQQSLHSKQKRNRRLRRAINTVPAFFVIGIATLITLIPFLIVLSIALKTSLDFANNPLGWPTHIAWQNFADAWTNGELGPAFINNILVTALSVAGLVVVGALGAYPLARIGRRWSYLTYNFFVAGLVIPTSISVIPLFKLFQMLNLQETYQGIIMLHIAQGVPLVIFLYTGFMKTIPRELDEAAAIDGASPFRIFRSIIFPLLHPVTATVVIITSLGIWNDFLSPLLFLNSEDKRGIPIAIFNFQSQYSNNWQLIFATIVLSMIPMMIVFIGLQRYFIKGIAGGALKG